MKSRVIGKDSDSGKDGGQEENRVAEDEMVGWHHRLNEHESEQTAGDSEGQERLAQRVEHNLAIEQQQKI